MAQTSTLRRLVTNLNKNTMKTYKSNISELTLKRTKKDFKKVQIKSSKDAANFARQFYHEDLTIYESFFLILVNSANNTIGYVKISQGGVKGTAVDPQLIAKFAVDTLATGVILVHNHPSGSTNPSNADKKLTKKIVQTLNIFDCITLDHIILTEDDYFSFTDNGLIKF